VAYQLAFPNPSKLHPIFHVSCLKKVIGTKCQTQASLPDLDEEGSIWLQPQVVLDQCEHRLRQCTIKEVLVQWKDTTPTDAT
jgi:predicted transglutaminase-like cysteine proteinase